MDNQPKWEQQEKLSCIREWVGNLHVEAKRLFDKDGTHGNMIFCFDERNGLISVNLIPQKVEHDQLNISIRNAVIEHNLYGIVFIGESWAYFIKENDHTAFQLLDGEMKVSELNDEDKKEILLVRMENSDGDCVVYWDEILRGEKGVCLGIDKRISGEPSNWFLCHNSFGN